MKKILLSALLLGMIVSTATAKWIDPPRKACTQNGGKLAPGGICKATWHNAKDICSAAGGRLATINELKKVVTSCGGEIDDYHNNRNDPTYQSCYKSKGFSASSGYWSSSVYVSDSSGAWDVDFINGHTYNGDKTGKSYVRCVRAGQ